MKMRTLFVIVVAAWSASCSGDATEPQPVITPITSAGGTVSSADGKVSLAVPAGALATATEITITPAAIGAQPGLVPGTAYTFEPDGLQFAVPARLTIRYDSIPTSLAGQASYLWLHRREGSDWVAMEGEPADTVNRVIAGMINGFSQYGGAVSGLAADILQVGLDLSAMLTDAIATNAIRLMHSVAALLQNQKDPAFQALAEPLLQASLSTACTAYSSALGNARDTPLTDYDQFTALLEPAYAWAATIQVLGGGPCAGAITTLQAMQDQKFREFIAFYLSRLNTASIGSSFDELIDEIRQLLAMRAGVQLLGLASVDARLEAEAQLPLLDALRTAAYDACRNLGQHEYLGKVLGEVPLANYSEQDIWEDLQYCATQVDWNTKSANGLTTNNGSMGGAATPGGETRQASTVGIDDGLITIDGNLRAFRCPGGSLEADELVVTLQGVEVHRRTATGGSFLPAPLKLDAITMLNIAGVDPKLSATVPLVLSRESAGCGLYVQSAGSVPLVTLDMTYPAPFVYVNDFSTPPFSEWSQQLTTSPPAGDPYHGPFLNGATTLSLGNLPAHSEIIIEFTFYAIGTMDGNNTDFGPDIVDFRIDNTNVLRTTFSNVLDAAFRQAYPDKYPGGSNPPGTGAATSNSLGYPAKTGQRSDTGYRITFKQPHTAGSLSFTVSGANMNSGESWGIDDVRVTVH